MARAKSDSNRRYITQTANEFGARTLNQIGQVLESHLTGVVEFAVHMQERLDAAEDLLAVVADAKVVRESPGANFTTVKLRTEVLEKIQALVASAKARNS